MTEYTYAGSELSLFEKARNWKSYYTTRLCSHVSGRVLEVGAGIGVNTGYFAHCRFDHWVSLEPDGTLAAQAGKRLPAGSRHECVAGTIADLPAGLKFDTILYIDVLEHIEDDRGEMRRAAARLNKSGALIVLSPAYQWLFTPFDQSIGHFRRYSRPSLAALTPAGLRLSEMYFLDSVGLLASLGNKMLLRSSMPNESQILLWDRVMVPVSRVLDRLTAYQAGRSIIGVWKS